MCLDLKVNLETRDFRVLVVRWVLLVLLESLVEEVVLDQMEPEACLDKLDQRETEVLMA